MSETPTTEQTPEDIRREIERTRRELGETVDNPVPLVAVAGGVVALWLLLRLVRRR